MGPDDTPASIPIRPRFPWDIKAVLRTDGVGYQTLYSQAVRHWSVFHDSLHEQNKNKISPNKRRVVLLSNLFENATLVCRTITQDVIDTDDGTSIVLDAVDKKDELTAVSDVYEQLQEQLAFTRRANEPFHLF